MTTLTRTQEYRDNAKNTGTYDIYIEIDTDCEELLDAADLDYEPVSEDIFMNEVCISLTPDEFKETFEHVNISDDYWNEVSITELLLNPEMCEYVTKVTIYKPNGDNITFC